MIIEFLKLILELCDVDHNMKNRLCDVCHKKKDRGENVSKLGFDYVFFHVLKMAYNWVLFMPNSVARRRNQL